MRKINRPRASGGLKAIFAYKLIKGALELIAAAVLVSLATGDPAQKLPALGLLLRQNVLRAWSLAFAEFILRAATPTRLEVAGLAFGLDGLLNAVEGWGLYVGYAWGPWLIVVSSGLFLPLELFEIYRKVHPGRVLIFLINLWIVVYLVRRTLMPHGRRD